jgi:hypothetical protein
MSSGEPDGLSMSYADDCVVRARELLEGFGDRAGRSTPAETVAFVALVMSYLSSARDALDAWGDRHGEGVTVPRARHCVGRAREMLESFRDRRESVTDKEHTDFLAWAVHYLKAAHREINVLRAPADEHTIRGDR